ncbi:hypothetical protein T440DRAFT_471513, partial [Plenodomus tracheiphilus IPT5]
MEKFHRVQPFEDWDVEDNSCALQRLQIGSDIGCMGAIAQIVSAAKRLKALEHRKCSFYCRVCEDGPAPPHKTQPSLVSQSYSALGDALR